MTEPSETPKRWSAEEMRAEAEILRNGASAVETVVRTMGKPIPDVTAEKWRMEAAMLAQAADTEEAWEEAHFPCTVAPHISRVCERGTDGCDVKHRAMTAAWQRAKTLEADLAREREAHHHTREEREAARKFIEFWADRRGVTPEHMAAVKQLEETASALAAERERARAYRAWLENEAATFEDLSNSDRKDDEFLRHRRMARAAMGSEALAEFDRRFGKA